MRKQNEGWQRSKVLGKSYWHILSQVANAVSSYAAFIIGAFHLDKRSWL